MPKKSSSPPSSTPPAAADLSATAPATADRNRPPAANQVFASDNTAGICPEAWAALAEANRGRLGEHELRIRTVGEACQRLVADDRIARELDDRLEDRMEGSVRDDACDVIAAPSALGPLGHVAADERPG